MLRDDGGRGRGGEEEAQQLTLRPSAFLGIKYIPDINVQSSWKFYNKSQRHGDQIGPTPELASCIRQANSIKVSAPRVDAKRKLVYKYNYFP